MADQDKLITDWQLRDDVSADVNFPADDGIQTYRVTATQIKNFVLSALSISTAMIQDLAVTAGKIAAGAVTDAKTNFTPPTVQRFTSGSGTYTTPTGVKYIRVRVVGGGGGGSGSGTASAGNGGNGTSSTFGSSLLTAAGGAQGVFANAIAFGGSITVNSPAIRLVGVEGGDGGGYSYTAVTNTYYSAGTPGGASFFGGQGCAPSYNSGGNAAQANSGSGGSGGGGSNIAGIFSGCGGAAGGFLEALIVGPSATYSYAVGAGGAGGTAGTSGYPGGAGADGVIIVEEYYQ